MVANEPVGSGRSTGKTVEFAMLKGIPLLIAFTFFSPNYTNISPMQTEGLIKFAGVTGSSAPPTITSFDRDTPTKPSNNLIVCPLSLSIFALLLP